MATTPCRSQSLSCALTAGLALLFALPSCFTMLVWHDDRSSERLHDARPPALQAWVAAEPPGAAVLHLTPELAARMREQLPAASSEWLLVRPLAVPSTVFAVLGLQCAGASERFGGLWAEWLVLAKPGEPAPRLVLRCHAVVPHPPVDVVRHLPGFHRDPGLYPSWSLAVPCTVQALPGPPDPASLGPAVPRPRLVFERRRDDGMPLAGRVLLTPLALLGDVVLSPFELLWWFTPRMAQPP